MEKKYSSHISNEECLESVKKIIETGVRDKIIPSFKIPDPQLILMYRAHEGDSEKILNCVESYICFRLEFTKNGFVEKTEIEHMIEKNIVYFRKSDKNGYPCIIVKVRNHVVGDYKNSDMLKYVVYLIDEAFAQMTTNSVTKVCIIWDREGYDKDKNFNESLGAKLVKYRDDLSHFLVEIVDKVYFLNINWFFRIMFNVAKVFIKPHLLKKIQLLGSGADLEEYFFSDNIPEEYK
jgi:hypothetical protein